MSIELGMNGKKLCGPNFSILYNQDYTQVIFGIRKNNHKDYSFAHDDFTNNFVNFWYKNRTFFFETKEYIYMFDLGDDTFKIPLNTPIKTSIINLDENDKPVQKSGKRLVFTLSNYH